MEVLQADKYCSYCYYRQGRKKNKNNIQKTMSKAEDRYLEYFQDGRLRNCSSREAFLYGYRQAERDLELTWEDMAFIRVAFDALEANIHLWAIKIQPMTKEYYQEVLKRFKERKEK